MKLLKWFFAISLNDLALSSVCMAMCRVLADRGEIVGPLMMMIIGLAVFFTSKRP